MAELPHHLPVEINGEFELHHDGLKEADDGSAAACLGPSIA